MWLPAKAGNADTTWNVLPAQEKSHLSALHLPREQRKSIHCALRPKEGKAERHFPYSARHQQHHLEQAAYDCEVVTIAIEAVYKQELLVEKNKR